MADNWYVILELEFDPPVEDEQKITEKIEERSKYWSAHFNDFKMGAQYRSWHQKIPQIKKDMLGSANIRKQLASDACMIVYEPIDKLLKTIGRKGNITSDEGDKLSKKLRISIDVVKNRAKKLGIKWIKSSNIDYQSIYDKYYTVKPLNEATYDGMKQMLSSFGVDNLYDFLYANNTMVKNASKLPCNTLYLRAAEKKRTEFYKNNSVSGTGSKLCGQCDIVFKDEESKNTYDKYLEYIKRKLILDDVKSIAEISGELKTEQGNEIIDQLTQILHDRKLSEDILRAFCKVERISYNIEKSEESIKIKICRCGCINDVSDGRMICANCGLELVIKCPICGNENDANIKVCKCGFKFEKIDKAIALCEQAEYAIDSLDFAVAKIYLNDAEYYWPNSSTVISMKQRLGEYEQRVGIEVSKMHEAINNKKYCEAKSIYQSIGHLFLGYSNAVIEEEINQAIIKAMDLFNQAKKTKVEKDIIELCAKAYELCVDLPGIKELMPEPNCITGFHASANPISRTNLISWITVNDRSIRYVVVRSRTSWAQHVSDGQIVFRGTTSSFVDNDIEANIPYYYNVFAERTGIYSKGAIGDFKEIVNLFEISGVVITAADSSLNISWDSLLSNASVEVYQIQDNETEKHITSCYANNYLVTNIINDKQYWYRVALSYIIEGKKQETKGIVISGVPTNPAQPIDTLHIKPVKEGQFEATWLKNNEGNVRLYGSSNKPVHLVGDVISVTDLEQKMFQLQQQDLPYQKVKTLKKNEIGSYFQYTGSDLIYVVAVIEKSGSVVFGNIARASVGETVTIKAIKSVNGKINIYINSPENATGLVVLHRFDQFPTDIDDTKAIRNNIPMMQYLLNSAIVLDTMEKRKYYFSVFSEFNQNEEKDYSLGADYIFDNSAKINMNYSISVNKKIFGESSVILEFEADYKEFTLPEIEIMSAIGNAPMFKESAKLFYVIPSQIVNGSVKVTIPISKNIQKDTYIKAFFKDDSMHGSNQLRLKLKSNYKIS